MLRSVVPKLGDCLRQNFVISPRNQDMIPLENWVLPWHSLLRSSTFSKLIEVNFFQKWLDILHIWLTQPAYKGDDIADWCATQYNAMSRQLTRTYRFIWWKSRFPNATLGMRGIAYGFHNGLELMDEAFRLGAGTPSKLSKPVFEPLPQASRSAPKPTTKARPIVENPLEITVRSLAEDFATQHDLIFLPMGRSNDRTGEPWFKVCKGVDARGGIMVYVGEKAVYAKSEDGSSRAVTLEEMVTLATA